MWAWGAPRVPGQNMPKSARTGPRVNRVTGNSPVSKPGKALLVLLRCPFLLLLICSGIESAHLRAQEQPTSKDENNAECVGSEVCQSCHEDQYKSFAESAHLQILRRAKPAEQGCEGCHGPGRAHVDTADPEKIRRFTTVSTEIVHQVCTNCHEVDLGAAHTKARLTCLTCHSVHHYTQKKSILIEPARQLCEKCHHH